MTGQPSAQTVALGERIAREASRVFARFWLSEMRVIEESIEDPADRWEILRRALRTISRKRSTP